MLEKHSKQKNRCAGRQCYGETLAEIGLYRFCNSCYQQFSCTISTYSPRIVEAAKILDPKCLPALPTDETKTTYGEEALDKLAFHYSNFIDRDECQSEWDMLKQCMNTSYKDETLQTFSLKLATDEGLKIQSPSISVLAEIILTFPASTAEVERGFSVQNTIKNKSRNRLGPEHLDQLIRMKLNAPRIEQFPFEKAYINWLDDKKRRYVVSRPQSTQTSK